MGEINLSNSEKISLFNSDKYKYENARKYLPGMEDFLSSIIVIKTLEKYHYNYKLDCGFTIKDNKSNGQAIDVYFYTVFIVDDNSKRLGMRIYNYSNINKVKLITFSNNILDKSYNVFFDSLDELKEFLINVI